MGITDSTQELNIHWLTADKLLKMKHERANIPNKDKKQQRQQQRNRNCVNRLRSGKKN